MNAIEPRELDFKLTPPTENAKANNDENAVPNATAFDILGNNYSIGKKPSSNPSSFSLSSGKSSPWRIATTKSGLVDDEISSSDDSSSFNTRRVGKRSNVLLDSDGDSDISKPPRRRLKRADDDTWKCTGCFSTNDNSLKICKICGYTRKAVDNLHDSEITKDFDDSSAAADEYFKMLDDDDADAPFPEVIDITSSPPKTRNKFDAAIELDDDDILSNDDLSNVCVFTFFEMYNICFSLEL